MPDDHTPSRLVPAWSPPRCWCCDGYRYGNPLRKCADCFGGECKHLCLRSGECVLPHGHDGDCSWGPDDDD